MKEEKFEGYAFHKDTKMEWRNDEYLPVEDRKEELRIADKIYQEYIAHNAAMVSITGRVHFRRWIGNELDKLEEK